MRTATNSFKIGLQLAACAALLLGPLVRAQDGKPDEKESDSGKADPSGTWTWSVPARNGGPDRTNTLTLKAEGDKLTGKLAVPGRDGQRRESTVDDGKVNGNEISFAIHREFNGNTFTAKYSGTVEADTIHGRMEFERNGETRTRDWEARRQAATAEKPGQPDSK
jgi:hypothetical protein